MSGISSILNIAKQAILAHQVSIEVAGNNVANVDTPGYTRQALHLTPAQSYPSPAGLIGTGVEAEYIQRFYDQFATARIMQESSNSKNLDAQLEAMQLVEASFNEAPGLALNDLMNQFWASWQDLSDNPESLPARQTVVQQSSLLVDKFQAISAEINQSKNDIGIRLTNGIESINSLTRQIAALNTQITTVETGNYHANELRDQRDNLLKQLSEMVDVTYFETDSGAYTVLLADGHALVETNEAWQVDWENNSLQWITYRRGDHNEKIEVKTTVGSGSELGGKVGGWLEIYGDLDAANPDSFAGKLNSLAYSLIREVNQQVSQGVGLYRFSGELQGTEPAKDTARLTKAIDIDTASLAVPAGTLSINDREVGKIEGGVPDFGLAKTKAANTVDAINDAITGVRAKLTTLVAGGPVTAVDPVVPAVGPYTFYVNGTELTVTIAGGDTADVIADNVVTAINSAGINVQAERLATGDIGAGANGGAADAIVLHNTRGGDDSAITLAGFDGLGIGLADGIHEADGVHNNTGEVTLFSVDPFTVKAGTDDTWLAHFGWDGGGVSVDDVANDGRFNYTAAEDQVTNSLQGMAFADELVTDGGSFQMWIYNTDGTLAISQPVSVKLDRAYDLEDVTAAINNAQTYVHASISSDGRVVLNVDNGYEFAFANDTSNLLQAAGLNTLFKGNNAGNMEVNSLVADDITRLAAATVGEFGDIFKGDNSNALLVTNIQRDENVTFLGQPNDTLDGFYNSLVGEIGLQGQTIRRDQEFHAQLSSQLNELRDSVSGVSLDEEMANLMKYQHAYSAAAKLITMADEMLQTLLQTI